MINEKCAKSYCSESISSIENYNKAVSDQEKMWDIHHRRETDSEGRTLFTKKQLKEMNLYLNRPASELIFVTRSMHKKIHLEQMRKCGKSTSIPILQLSKDGTFVKEWPSLIEVERQLGIARQNIGSCLKGRYKTSGGFIWRYKHGRI